MKRTLVCFVVTTLLILGCLKISAFLGGECGSVAFTVLSLILATGASMLLVSRRYAEFWSGLVAVVATGLAIIFISGMKMSFVTVVDILWRSFWVSAAIGAGLYLLGELVIFLIHRRDKPNGSSDIELL